MYESAYHLIYNEKIEKPEVNPNEQEVSVKLIICSNILIYIYHSIADNL